MQLSPAEALVLLDPEDPSRGIEAAKVTFLGLLAEGVLCLRTERGRITTSQHLEIVRQPAETPPHVAAVLDAIRASRTGKVAEVARRLARATDRYDGFISALVRPRLVQRGLLEERRHQEQRRFLFVFRRTVTVSTFHLTDSGRREQAALQARLDEAPAIREALDRDPPRAAAMAAALGPLLVLVPSLLTVLGPLAAAMNQQGMTMLSNSSIDGTFDSFAGDFSDSLDSALSDSASDGSSDSSSDSGGDSGGSDGGGGGE